MQYPPSKTPPWRHQVECWKRAKDVPAFYVAHDMGAGKSKVAVDYCNGINAKKVLIICPKKVISVWPSQFNKHSHARFRLLAKENGSIASQSEEIKKFISTYENYGGVAVVLNYERFWRAPLGPSYNERNRMVDIGLLSKIQWDLLIADEAHRIKAPNGQAAWGMARLAQRVPRRLFLSGTPMPHSPLDIYSQFRALAPEVFGRKYTAFKMNYCIMGGFENRQVVAFKNLEDLHNKFYSIAHRVTIEEAVDLPEFNDVNIDVDLSPKAKKIYSQLEREFIAECENGEITADNSLTKLLRLAQIAGGNLKLDSGREEIIDSGKIDTAAEIIQDLPPDEPVVVFARFRSEIERMKQAVTGLGRKPGEITGSQNDLKKWGAGEIDTVVVQIQACGEGIDLTRSRYCIYLSKGYSLGQVMQSRARVHRPGQSRKVTYYHINAKGTVDVLIERAIKTKQKITNDVLDIKDIVLNELKEECHVGHRETDEIREAV